MCALYHLIKRHAATYLATAATLLFVSPGAHAAGVTIRFAGDSDVGLGGKWTKERAEEWAKKTGNKVEYINRPKDATATLQQFQQYWAAHSPDVDVYMVDVIWAGIAAPHAVDLKKYFKDDEIKEHFPRIIANNTIDGKLVSIPFFTDAGLLYYRTDLLKKYGYDKPPETWEELATMAKKIQDGERQAGQKDFQGFVFEGNASESVTCNALEWIFSYGGGTIIDPDKKVTINNPNAIKALETAKSWIGTISPKGVTTYQEDDARNVWQGGNAAFMRNWPYAYGLGQDASSPIKGKFDIVVLPKGGDSGQHAACLGGWNLLVSAYSKNPDAGADLVKYLSSEDVQKRRMIDLTQLPTRPSLYKDPDILSKDPWTSKVLDVLNNAVARPSTVTGSDYNQVSTSFFQNVNSVLTGGEQPQQAVSEIERVAKGVVQ